jgi:SAM-dependent methyltransferase
MNKAQRFFYPETDVGGFSRVDGTIEFYTRVNALLESEATVLDFGAGRGVGLQDDPVAYRRRLQTLKDKCSRTIGVDVDDAVNENPGLDEAHVVMPGDRIPVESSSVDLILSDHTFEHIDDPQATARELGRVLKPGGWICARTPNRWGYIGLGTNLVPNRLHVSILRRLQKQRKAVDVFPTVYRLNTRRSLRRYFPPERYEHFVYGHFSEPAYFGESRILWALMLLTFRLTPEVFAPTWMIFLRKK